jgi:hypothetical protein
MLTSRINHQKISIKNKLEIQSGLYLFFNGSKTGAGSNVLFEHGSLSDLFEDVKNLEFLNPNQGLSQDDALKYQETFKITFDAIHQINKKYEDKPIEEFSHFLPPEIGEDITPNDLDTAIEEAFQNGVLHQIDKTPRMSMRYDVEILPTSRVKRYANNYQAHLVAHSECWQQRTLVGIIPKKLLAKVSEDEVAIYENFVYARLIDHLLQYLASFQTRLQQILDFLKEFGAFETADKDHRLTRQITEDWGRAFKNADIKKLTDESESLLRNITKYKSKLIQLQAEKLYRAIPKSVQVPIGLKQTNILMHDKNYKRLGVLWRKWLKNTNNQRLSSAQILEQKIHNFNAYSKYVENIVCQSFINLGWKLEYIGEYIHLTHSNTFKLKLNKSRLGEWEIQRNESLLCKVIAISEPIAVSYDFDNARPEILLVSPYSFVKANEQIINLSPIELEGKELLVGKIQQLIIMSIIKEYLTPFKVTLPNIVKTYYQARHNDDLTNSELAEIQKHVNKGLYEIILSKSNIAKFFKQCPCCSKSVHENQFIQSSREFFRASCPSKQCKATWELDLNKTTFKLNDGRRNNGRFSFIIDFSR